MQAAPVDHVLPEGKWAFNAEVTNAFEDMLQRSIPQYEVMRKACFDLASRYAQANTVILDLGCSRGEAMAPLLDKFGAQNHFLGIEVSKPMLEAVKERFKGWIQCGVVEIKDHDLRRGYPPVNASVTLSILTLHFTPIEYRQRIIRDVFKHTLPGGAFLLVEKVLGGSAELDQVLVDHYFALKSTNGYSPEEIERKRWSLEGVLVPMTARWNEELLRMAGFTQVECFWRWMNFAGWIAVKDQP